jgi:ketosteroid isomerase-like protein
MREGVRTMVDQANTSESDSTIQAEQDLNRINEEWVAALLRHDTETLNRLMAEDCIFTYALDGEDKAQFIVDIESNDLQFQSFKRDNVEVRIYGSTGVLIAFDTAHWRYKGRDIQGYYRTIHVYSERDGTWQIVAIQASPISLK